jgi:hypothetical protein
MTHGLRCAPTAQARESDEPSVGISGSGSCSCAGSVMAPLVLSLPRGSRPLAGRSHCARSSASYRRQFLNVLATVRDGEVEKLPDGDWHQFIDVDREIPRTIT